MSQSALLSAPRVKLAPATLAVCIQLLALVAVFASVVVANYFSPVRFSPLSLVLLQSLAATAFCYVAGMAVWWRWIHALFPAAIWGMSFFAVPNEVYLIGFLFTLGVFWTSFRSQVPFFPSRPMVWQKVAALMPQDKPVRLVEIGSGLGDFSMYIAHARTNSQVEGIEVAPLPCLISKLRARFRRSTAEFTLGDYNALHFAQYDFVFAYLSPAAMSALWKKAKQEMQAGSLLISYEFNIPNVKPTLIIENGDQAPVIYVWQL